MEKRIWKKVVLFLAVFLLSLSMGQQASAAKIKTPTGLKADYDKNFINLTWKKLPKATGYVVYRYSSVAKQYIRVGETKKNSYYMDDLPEGTLYRFKVRAYRVIKGKTYYSGYSKKLALRTKKEPTKKVSTLKKYLQNAIKPIGKAIYVWGGGWSTDGLNGSIEARSIGVSSTWTSFFNAQTSDYNFYNTQYQRHNGLDCSGYVGWTIYNMMNTKSGNNGYVMSAKNMAKNYASRGWGTYIKRSKVKDYKPGDIMSSACTDCGHVWIVIGTCSDGSVVVLHSSSNAGVQLSGTVAPDGKVHSQAAELADKYMKQYYPNWCTKFSTKIRDEKYLSHFCQMRWGVSGKSVLTDPDGYQNMTAEEVLADLIGPLKEEVLAEPPAPEVEPTEAATEVTVQ
jgi:cell wall-associated NlpC family hydrolase